MTRNNKSRSFAEVILSGLKSRFVAAFGMTAVVMAMAVSTLNTDILTASLGKPVAVAYGRHVVAGNVILLEERSSKILDIVQDVRGSGSGRSEPSTGVRRTQ